MENYDALSKDEPNTNLNKAFDAAEKNLGIPRMLDPEDLVNMVKPDEEAVMTYVAELYHKFAAQEDVKVAVERIVKVLDKDTEIEKMMKDYGDMANEHLEWLRETLPWLQRMKSLEPAKLLADDQLKEYKRTLKPQKMTDKAKIGQLFNINLHTKLMLEKMPVFVPGEGKTLSDIAEAWRRVEEAERELDEVCSVKQRERDEFAYMSSQINEWLAQSA